MFVANRNGNVYTINFDDLNKQNIKCFSTIEKDNWLWLRRLGHVNIKLINKLFNHDVIVN